ncbi:hypothetical protein HYH03_011817 [Edaphochlamys debaryana]|uniref:G8 domain-containing protein n=1 Tax=Edaphochlamys debaryana TaxID=47281 RepID=A0A835XZF2_9CHLO|nr:hypothetical protein HYH03_011817 [Edaphochlamys debaryana]|eukprot:KAG2489710.1 hypothetical protein HYH03_011817 [Edaphochlamys debaryana]
MDLTLTSLLVHGALTMGSPTCRLAARISITFMPGATVPASQMVLRGLNGSRVDMHGALYTPTWTRLAQTAANGSSSVVLRDAVNWKAGQLVVIPTSIWKDECRNQNEVRQIASVSADRKTLTFTTALQFLHYGGPEYQTEVVLLSRNILLQGTPDTASLLAGGHVRIESQLGRIRGVMAYRMGQQLAMGSYPFHFHMAGDVGGNSYLTDNSVYASYWRAYTIHGTHALQVRSNTAFHVHGSAFYIEDAAEERNTIDGNFAGFVHPLGRNNTCDAIGSVFSAPTIRQSATLLQPADWAASGFYISNPNNYLTNNAASGGVSGFVIIRLDSPIGLSRNVPIKPFQRPMGLLSGNTAHSSGYHWGEAATIYAGGSLKYDTDNATLIYSIQRSTFDPRDLTDSSVKVKFKINNTKVWLGGSSISTYGDRFVVDGFESHDGTVGAQIRGDPNELLNADLSLNSGHSGWLISRIPNDLPLGYRYGLQWYDTFYRHIVRNVTIRNVPYNTTSWANQAAVLSLVHSDQFKPGHLVTLRGIRLVNVSVNATVNNALRKTGAWRFYNFLDSDGSFTATGRPTVMASFHPTNDTSTCASACRPFNWWLSDTTTCSTAAPWGNVWNLVGCDWYPWRTVARLIPKVPGYTLNPDQSSGLVPSVDGTNAYDAGVVTQFGFTGAATRATVLTRTEGVTGLTGKTGWYVHWALGAPRVFSVEVDTVPRGTSVVYATRYPAGTTFNITRIHSWLVGPSQILPAASLAEALNSPAAEAYYFDGKILYLKVIDMYELPIQGRTAVTNGGALVPGTRWDGSSYRVEAAMPAAACVNSPPPTQNGQDFSAQFCTMTGTPDDYIPPAITESYDQWTLPYCAEVAPPVSVCTANGVSSSSCTCTSLAAAGRCPDMGLAGAWLAASGPEMSALAGKTGGFCAVACGRCTENEAVCMDMPMPLSVSGGKTCAEMVPQGGCYSVALKGFCGATCGACNGRGLPCTDRPWSDTNTCKNLLEWGLCNASWVLSENYCRATCGACAGPPPPPLPPMTPPPPPQPLALGATFDTGADGYSVWLNSGQAVNPQATYGFAAPEAAYGGTAGGLWINVTQATGIDWHVQAESAPFEVLSGRLYNFCAWARLGPNSPTATAPITVGLQNTTTYEWMGGRTFTGNMTWQRFCVFNLTKGANPYLTQASPRKKKDSTDLSAPTETDTTTPDATADAVSVTGPDTVTPGSTTQSGASEQQGGSGGNGGKVPAGLVAGVSAAGAGVALLAGLALVAAVKRRSGAGRVAPGADASAPPAAAAAWVGEEQRVGPWVQGVGGSARVTPLPPASPAGHAQAEAV